MTAHSIGLVIVVGLLLMGLVATAELSLLILASAASGAIVGFLLWLRHR
jgi:UDP-N-acetylmuramyl pentapeptide phosphotransferase/UDP-N-acetylglucosamine-1-phosphate transferase